MSKKEMTFEQSMERLEEVLESLENGNESLDQSLKLYEEGIALVRACTERLEHAEQRVKILQMGEDGNVTLANFTSDDKGE